MDSLTYECFENSLGWRFPYESRSTRVYNHFTQVAHGLVRAKGSGLFREERWRTITKESYCAYTIPIILGYMLQYLGLQFQQGGSPGHGAAYTLDYISKYCGIIPVFWPHYLQISHQSKPYEIK